MTSETFRSGYVAFIGRPNAGKSTLLNHLVGEKIAAVSNKPQTTRHKIQGIVTSDDGQIVFVDTPGVHKPGYLLNRRMMSAVHDAILSVDVLVLMRDASVSTGNGDRFVLDLVKDSDKPAVLVLNKIDLVETQHIASIEYPKNISLVVQTAAANNQGIDALEKAILEIVQTEKIQAADMDFAINQRQAAALTRAKISLEQVQGTIAEQLPFDFWTIDLRSAIYALGEITGEEVTESVLDRIFHKFCIGK